VGVQEDGRPALEASDLANGSVDVSRSVDALAEIRELFGREVEVVPGHQVATEGSGIEKRLTDALDGIHYRIIHAPNLRPIT